MTDRLKLWTVAKLAGMYVRSTMECGRLRRDVGRLTVEVAMLEAQRDQLQAALARRGRRA